MNRHGRPRSTMPEHLAVLRARAQTESWQQRLEIATPKPGWITRRACAGMPITVMYPDSRAGNSRALNVCQGCPVRLSCLGAARIDEAHDLARGTYGIRGGLIPSQRLHVYKMMHRNDGG